MQREEPRRAQRVVQRRVVVLTEHVEVLAERAREELGLSPRRSSADVSIRITHRSRKGDVNERNEGRTTCGMIVTLDRSASRLIACVGTPS